MALSGISHRDSSKERFLHVALVTVSAFSYIDFHVVVCSCSIIKQSTYFFKQAAVLCSLRLLSCLTDRYCAAITGVLPKDPLKLAEAEQAYCCIADIWEVSDEAAVTVVTSADATTVAEHFSHAVDMVQMGFAYDYSRCLVALSAD